MDPLGDNTFSAGSPALAGRVAASVEAEGYAVVTGLLDEATCAELTREVARVEEEHRIPRGTNDFEGFHTRRIFNLISRGPAFRRGRRMPSRQPLPARFGRALRRPWDHRLKNPRGPVRRADPGGSLTGVRRNDECDIGPLSES